MTSIRVLELYSGIGGMHWALKESGVPYTVVMAVDINTTANDIYKYNFPDTDLHSFGIEKLSVKKLSSLQIDAILMSPPCQPFTRVGNKADTEDIRTKSFLHILGLLLQIEKKPTYILVENVKGFEESETRAQLVSALQKCGYSYQEFMLTPLQFGIPNCRLRYYLIAKLNALPFLASAQVLTNLPNTSHVNLSTWSYSHSKKNTSTDKENFSEDASISLQDTELLRNAGRNMRYCEEDEPLVSDQSQKLAYFMENGTDKDFHNYILTDKELRMFVIMDIVFPSLKKSTCFTKRYGHYMEGAGSVVQMTTDHQVVQEASQFKSQVVELKNSKQWGEEELIILRKLKLRYFTPREVANLLCFPPEFSFPCGLQSIQKYRVLGNSLNVHVVALLIKIMTQS